ncbi:MAG: FAD-dependent oxidoreductase [Actinomycetales bacterium]|nr:FAD-dependent oxidoreductase [Actinomycetales bacterium]
MTKVAIVGSGVSGLTAAYLLRDLHKVTLFEADQRFGGHAHTHTVEGQRIDSGFIVHNERTYPNLLRIFKELNIKTQETEMTMSIDCDGCGLQYVGGRGAKGILAKPIKLLDPRFVKLLIDVPRFYKQARKLLQSDLDSKVTWGEFLEANNFNEYFRKHYAIPVVSCVWSSGDGDSLKYPARHLFEFLNHHGMLELGNSPIWKTVVGGSNTYVEAILNLISDKRNEKVTSVKRFSDHVEVNGESFDFAIIATHANAALEIMTDASAEERAKLADFGYSSNQTILHKDSSMLPTPNKARASWNYKMDCKDTQNKVVVSYWMNLLMRLKGSTDYVVTLNADVDADKRIATMKYEHPVFTVDALEAAKYIKSAGGPRLAFAGAHLGWGFHEDGARSGVEAARKFGATW